ncbi:MULTISPECIES: ethylbenzene dehydrogenase-related protein [Haloarcula]|uniref:ethylbenzene dehydrogenase-related protein n=1 Tax=Haloarcula TaxID=2237 RepID=UPI0023EC38D5|nr:ethylbenzene dehydrogenase-related protein [Halomicroarcula sp. XH51]
MGEGRPSRVTVSVVCIAALVVLTSVATPFASARPAHEIPFSEVQGSGLASPTADGWDGVPSSDVALGSAPSSVPNADDTTVETVHVQAARSDERLFVRLQWHDATRDVGADSMRRFNDAVAVQFPVNTSARPPIAMGGQRNMVNVWYWSSDTGTQELLAGGPGSTTAFPDPAVSANATYHGSGANATWTVVYVRDLEAAGENRTTLETEGDLDVAFAVWNGSNAERAGQKSVSEWHYFPSESRSAGPPFEALLWSVAGVAVVAVVAVTAFGVARARGGMQ